MELVAMLAAGSAGGSYGPVAIGVTVVATVVVLALLVAVVALVRYARALRTAAEELRVESLALLRDLDGTVARAGEELDRVDDLIGSAERLSSTVGSASGLAYSAVANPVIKVMALGAGTARASERIRRRRAKRR
jgi:predicted PurR-regulated permease PerM